MKMLDRQERMVKTKTIDIQITASVDINYVDDFEDFRNQEWIQTQVEDAVKEINLKCHDIHEAEYTNTL